MQDILGYSGPNYFIDIPLAVLLVAATYTDIRYGKVYNRLTFPLILAGIILQTAIQFPAGLGKSLLGILTAFILLVVPFALYWLRGGDVKALMAVGALAGPYFTLIATLFSAIAGGIIALILMFTRGLSKEKLTFLWKSLVCGTLFHAKARTDSGESLFPYTPAILIGTGLAYLELNYGPFFLG